MYYKVLVVALVAVFLLNETNARKTSSGRSRGTSSRGSSRSKTGYNPAPAPIPAPAPKPQQTKPYGWQVSPKETSVRKDLATSQHAAPPSNQQSHSYPVSSGGLSGSGAIQQQNVAKSNSNPQQSPAYPSNNQQSHAYPTNNQQNSGYPGNNQQAHSYPSNNPQSQPYPQNGQQSQAYASNNQQSHAYPASNGLSGHSGSANYPTNTGGLSGGAPPPYSAHVPSGHVSSGGGSYPTNNAGYPHNNYGGSYPHQGAYPQQGYNPYQGNKFGQGPPAYQPSYGQSGFGAPGGSWLGGYGNSAYGNRGVSRGGGVLKGLGIAGVGAGTLLTGLALWNLARSSGSKHYHVHYDKDGNAVAAPIGNGTEPIVDSVLGELVNCTLSVTSPNSTEVIGIPCAIATSFTPSGERDAKVPGDTEETKCIITVVNSNSTEFMTTIPCSILISTAASHNVTDPPLITGGLNQTDVAPLVEPAPTQNSPLVSPVQAIPENMHQSAMPDCKLEPGAVPDPINPCVAIAHDLSVIPLTPDNATAAAA